MPFSITRRFQGQASDKTPARATSAWNNSTTRTWADCVRSFSEAALILSFCNQNSGTDGRSRWVWFGVEAAARANQQPDWIRVMNPTDFGARRTLELGLTLTLRFQLIRQLHGADECRSRHRSLTRRRASANGSPPAGTSSEGERDRLWLANALVTADQFAGCRPKNLPLRSCVPDHRQPITGGDIGPSDLNYSRAKPAAATDLFGAESSKTTADPALPATGGRRYRW